MPSSHLILCRPLLLLPSIPLSIRVISNESTLRMRWHKYWSFNFSIIPSKEHPVLISFKMEWLYFFAVQGTHSQESSPTPQFKSINSSTLSFLHSPTLTSIHDYWKNHALTWWTFVGKVWIIAPQILAPLPPSGWNTFLFFISVGSVHDICFGQGMLVDLTWAEATDIFAIWLGSSAAGASLMAQKLKNLPAMRETWVQSLGWEDPLEKGKATHSSILG